MKALRLLTLACCVLLASCATVRPETTDLPASQPTETAPSVRIPTSLEMERTVNNSEGVILTPGDSFADTIKVTSTATGEEVVVLNGAWDPILLAWNGPTGSMGSWEIRQTTSYPGNYRAACRPIEGQCLLTLSFTLKQKGLWPAGLTTKGVGHSITARGTSLQHLIISPVAS